MKLGKLVTRVVIGSLFVGHGTQKLYGWFDGPGPDATAVSVDSASRMNPSAARNSCFASPWLLSASASGGPEIVVTEYSTPRPPPNATPAVFSDRIGRRKPAAFCRGRFAALSPSLVLGRLFHRRRIGLRLRLTSPLRSVHLLGVSSRHPAEESGVQAPAPKAQPPRKRSGRRTAG